MTTDVTYRTVDGATLKLDVYRPTAPGTYPAVVLVHQGGWNSNNKTSMDTEGQRYASNGVAAFSIDYRLAPVHHRAGYTAPAASDDTRAAVAWVRAHAAQWGVNPAKVGCQGPSAGGHLCSMAGSTGAQGADRPDAVADWSGPADLPNMPTGDPNPENYMGCSRDACPQKWLDNSPYYVATPSTAPHYIAHSTGDRYVPYQQSVTLDRALTGLGVEHVFRSFDGGSHGEALRSVALDETVAWMKAHLQ